MTRHAADQHDHLERFDDDPDPLTPEQKTFFRRRFCCIDCGKCTHCSGEYYMVRDALWEAAGIAPEGSMLCLADLERRIGRTLTTNDFTAKMPSFDAWQQHIKLKTA